MKRKLALCLSLLSVIMMLGACGNQDPTTVDYNGVTYDELQQTALYYGTGYAGASEETMQLVIEELNSYSREEKESEDFQLVYSLSVQWAETLEECGAFIDIKEDEIKIEKSGKTLTTDLLLEFEERDVVFQMVYNYHNMKLTGISINPEYGFWEKMGKAGLNTVISMSIVFAMLFAMCGIIYCFKFLPKLMGLFSKKETPQVVETKTDVVTQMEAREEQELVDDTELVAVIAAAIAAYEGTSTDGFVVRSIRRR